MGNKKEKEEIIFFEDEKVKSQQDKNTSSEWNVMIVDDETEVHSVSKLVLNDIEFQGKGINFISAYTGEEARSILQKRNDIALVLLDVVMEEENSGLILVKYIREELKNFKSRIILRTGYPGHAPESNIIINYDINDYKEKTELSSRKLITAVITALRSYNDILKLHDLNVNLEKKVEQRTSELVESNEKLNHSLKLIQRDLEAGREIQQKLLPAEKMRFNDIEFESRLFASLYLSGDFYDYYRIDDNNIGFYFADVAGHGASSAFVTVFLKRFFDKQLLEYVEGLNKNIFNPADLMNKLNISLLNTKLEKHVTIFYGIIDLNEYVLKYSNCAQFPYPFLYNDNVFEMEKHNMPIGLFKFAEYKEDIIELDKDFRLIFLSDGILEIIENDNIDEKIAILKQIVSKKISLDELVEKFNIYGIDEIPDDITILSIKGLTSYE